ncbi:hypothetical protein DB88DRAFT_543735 [Papiliotrema laurentii]|uniref:Phospholipase/carboxylesterase/thioesterase domain-containing protein n=1 Tax=Papiliotrema laurentii TaxID=5418 RepID=A0AAD9L8K9_PAPLA|nr:hypothetical protein DB88DRAFT_543735 [Papiliotrema laurentii]
MPDLNLRPVQSSQTSSASSSKPIPAPSILKPWQFSYASSPDGKDLNLLIMFHGLGDTKEPFANLGRQLNLPSTAVLSLQAPDPIPLMETPCWSWYNTFTPLFEPLPNPNPSTALPPLRALLSTLTSPEIGWDLTQIHLFGFGQGGTIALELALDIGKRPIPPAASSGGSTHPTSLPGKRLGSVVSICAGLISFPSSSLDLETPVAMFTRVQAKSQVGQKMLSAVQRAFKHVEVVQAPGGGEAMPRGKDEWQGIMKFWGQVLAREETWKGEGEVYEVVK